MQGHLSMRGVAFVIPNGCDGHTHIMMLLHKSYCTVYNENTSLYDATNTRNIRSKTTRV